ncbi:ethanolaminephosphotransferase 1-like isoform X1 [Nilaparvata lugens]|uniref:ethanolaminephosphotransferase 1-like isoform X1 n=2 Tax=Nilaparvata lugens TaxID=108931 RepID=UPI00193D742D|nr:ethanolaminephosphotransferase 1-like isoform X1 [Nilaparvata lugens]
MQSEYLTQKHLSGFEHYKYSSIDTSPISVYIMHPFWNKVVEWVPKSVAPNVLTFVGFLFTAGACLLLSIYDYHFYANSTDFPQYATIPRWVYLVTALSIFIAYTLDGIDGKQARRTNTSGPLGELFDHGLDSWTAVLIPTCLYSIFGRTDFSVPPLRFYYICWNVFVTFYLSHWEKYNTGVLFLPWGYDLSMLGTTGVFLVTYFCGQQCWKFNVYGDFSTGHCLELLFYLSSILTSIPIVLYNIYASYRDKTGKMRSFTEANRPLVPLAALMFICALWVYNSPSNIVAKDPRAFYLFTGTVFSNICCRLIVAQMSGVTCDVWNWLLGPTLLCVGVAMLFPSQSLELVLLYSLWALAMVAHIHYGSTVVRQMCRHFRISCFKIRKPHLTNGSHKD